MADFVKTKRHVLTDDGYKTLSQWTNAESVEMNNGNSVQTEVTNLKNPATTAANGLMTSTDKAKLNTIATSANNYVHPTATSHANGLYKVSVDGTGHVTSAVSVVKNDITALGIPGSDTTYAAATTATAGLMTTAMVSKLAGIDADANNYTHPSYTSYASGLRKFSTDSTGHVNGTAAVAKSDITALGIPATDTTYAVVTSSANGLTPKLSNTATQYLNGTGAWTVPTNTTYAVATTTANGLMTSTDKAKLDGIEASANAYSHPTYTSAASGLYKVAVDNTGHVNSATAVTKADITALGIPESDTNTTYATFTSAANGLVPAAKSGTTNYATSGYVLTGAGWKAGTKYNTDNNTTYAAVTTAANGLMTSADKSKLDGIEAGAEVNTITGVKGNAESSYRTGNVNLTPANIGAIASSEKGVASGVVPLNASGVIDSTYLPSYVDDVLEYSSKSAFPATGESGKIYVDTSVEENNTYRWSGSTYILIAKNTNTTYTLSKSGSTITLTGSDGSTNEIADSDTTYATFTSAANGLVPAAKSGTTNYATSGYVLTGAGWKAGTKYNTNTTYAASTTAANGLMTSTDKAKLDGIEENANNYSHPTYTSYASALRKFTTDTSGHVSATAAVAKADITDLGIPAQDTTYAAFTSAAAGLVPAAASGTTNYATSGYVLTGAGWKAGTKYNTDNNTTYAAATTAASGLMPALNGSATVYLNGTGAWTTPTNTTYGTATTGADGLMTSAMVTKLNSVAASANNYTHPSYTSYASGLRKFTVDATGHVSATAAVTKSDITALGIPESDTNTTYANYVGATASAAGTAGLVPAATTAQRNMFLRGDATWQTPTNTTYAAATTAANGLMTSADKTKLDSVAASANNYTHPTYTSYASGLRKFTTDTSGHVSATAAVAKSDITGLGIPAQDTTYAAATTAAAGLMTAAMVTKLNGIATGANAYTHPTYTSAASGLYKVAVDGTGHVSGATAVAKTDITGLGIPASDTTYAAFTSAATGLVPAASSGTTNYATSGYVLTGAGWKAGTKYNTDNNTTYAAATTAANGLMTSADKTKLDSVAASANNYTHPSYTSAASGFRKFTIDATGHVSATAAVTKADITALGIPESDTNTTYAAFTSAAAGLVPAASSGTTNYATSGYVLTGAGWKVGTKYNTDNNTTYAAATTAAIGLMPALTGSTTVYLNGNGAWTTPTNTTYGTATTGADGLMTSAMVTKLNGIATGANAYTHPSYTSYASGLRKFTVDATGHVSATAAVTKSDITALGIPASDTNTTYATFTSAANGLVPAAKSGSTNYATTGYVLTGAGWAAGTKYNTDTNTTYAAFTSAAAGLVPAAASGTTSYLTSAYVLTGAGWAAGTKYNTDTNTTYAAFTSAAAGLVPAAASESTNYATTGYVLTGAGWAAGTKYNTDTNTTYGAATSAAQGLTKASYVSGTTLVVF